LRFAIAVGGVLVSGDETKSSGRELSTVMEVMEEEM